MTVEFLDNMDIFTAAQAAQKYPSYPAPRHCSFTAAQAAQKNSTSIRSQKQEFTAAQAAQKIKTL